jgi:dynein intermediate chain 2
MADEFTYPKKRKEFGRYGQFDDTDTKIVGSVQPDQSQNDQYVRRDPNRMVLTNIEKMSQHGVNTDIVPTGNKGMKHTEGGWPSEIDPTEPDQ